MGAKDLVLGSHFLLRVHTRFMKNPRFWYDKNLIEADGIVVVLLSGMRTELLSKDDDSMTEAFAEMIVEGCGL